MTLNGVVLPFLTTNDETQHTTGLTYTTGSHRIRSSNGAVIVQKLKLP
jgi:hypothetical protein